MRRRAIKDVSHSHCSNFNIPTLENTYPIFLLTNLQTGLYGLLFQYINLTLVMGSFDWSRAAHVTCDKSSCHPLGNIVLPSQIASCHPLDFCCCRERYFFKSELTRFEFSRIQNR